MPAQHDKHIKLDVIRYYDGHKELGLHGCAENIGIGCRPPSKALCIRLWNPKISGCF